MDVDDVLVKELMQKIKGMDAGQLLLMNEYAQELLHNSKQHVIYSMNKDGKVTDVRFIKEEVKVIELVQKHFGKDAVQFLSLFSELNETGRKQVLNDINELTTLPKFKVE